MKGNEINQMIYNKLVNLNYSRKENDLISVNSTNWFELEDKLKDDIKSFPSRNVS